MAKETITKLGLYLSRKPLSQAKLARMTGISKDRISRLHVDLTTKPTIDEVYLISLALEVNLNEIAAFLCKDLKLRPKSEWDVTPSKKTK
ncbi:MULTISPECIES: helix-turn-helix domain-containing protein [Olivibacter]|uniref:Helix-turn-helix domain-containing protein n=1 Tax=Olivibacter oleidegradans TaxID=760123 RepID=A0ABV6HMG4_9SPHI|nr:helix-turn-helix transcriptional regulator [Olivibacter jilunii]MDX3914538.1 helix-turn-helix transcriptional regulator [Pseudosphingobacterium sp.]